MDPKPQRDHEDLGGWTSVLGFVDVLIVMGLVAAAWRWIEKKIAPF